ncbi:MAG TPA: GAF domain-containing protein [Rhodobacteraceae bacterium]|jgi:transcriptional regulator with GAF, ATPase, and Fis domain|nr:GAF domain-containing protein [Tateyamaria sp.]HCW83516.1 GAF domain-containing protein [Paracoccaceae bacterium]
MTDITKAMASRDQPMATFKALEALVDQAIGVKLFTLMEVDHDRGVARRNYSNMPDAYAASGEKPIEDNAWTEQVQGRQEIFVANSIEEIAAVFPDHALIKSLGCESCMNVPIVVNGNVIGTLNCLHDAGHFTPERVAAAEGLKQAGALAFLLDDYMTKGAN